MSKMNQVMFKCFHRGEDMSPKLGPLFTLALVKVSAKREQSHVHGMHGPSDICFHPRRSVELK